MRVRRNSIADASPKHQTYKRLQSKQYYARKNNMRHYANHGVYLYFSVIQIVIYTFRHIPPFISTKSYFPSQTSKRFYYNSIIRIDLSYKTTKPDFSSGFRNYFVVYSLLDSLSERIPSSVASTLSAFSKSSSSV